MGTGSARNLQCWCGSGLKLKKCHVHATFRSPMYRRFGNHRLYRPSPDAEHALREAAATHVRALFAPGEYTNAQQINTALQRLFDFYDARLSNVLSHLGSRELMDVVLHEFDTSVHVENLSKDGHLAREDEQAWRSIGPNIGRALKHLAERIVLLAPSEPPGVPRDLGVRMVDVAWLCAEQMVILYNVSDQVYFAPTRNVFRIFDRGNELVWSHSISDPCLLGFGRRIERYRESYSDVLGPLTFDMDPLQHEEVLGPAFRDSLGVGYRDALSLLTGVIEARHIGNHGFTTRFVCRDSIVEWMAEDGHCSRAIAERILDGFTITRENMLREGRALYRPKQQHRAFRRAFFDMPHATGRHLAWSPEMARQSLMFLIRGFAAGRIPSEWDHPGIRRSTGELVNRAGAWLEAACQAQLETLGFVGAKGLARGVGRGSARIEIPQEIGELDYLGLLVAEQRLVLIECKLLQAGVEARHYRDDAMDFLKEDGYAEKFHRKASWVRQNAGALVAALASVAPLPVGSGVTSVASCFVTLYPSMANCLLPETPCVSLVELVGDIRERAGWPYAKGVTSVS